MDRGPTAAHLNDVRTRYVLVRHDPVGGALVALLRLGASEDSTARRALRELGFVPNASPANAPMSLKRSVSTSQLADVCASVSHALGEAAVLDLGASFTETVDEPVRAALPAANWDGRFLLHVGGTRRCVLFDASTDEQELTRAVTAARNDYYANDFHPATE